MTDFDHLLLASTHRERVAGRKLERDEGLSPQAALERTLHTSAGAGGLALLFEERAEQRRIIGERRTARQAQRAAAREQHHGKHDGPASAWRAWFDGSARPNPGACGIGALLRGPDGQRLEVAHGAGYGNSGEAEYRALIALLDLAIAHQAHDLTIYGDSRVVVDDINGDVPAPALQALREQSQERLRQLDKVQICWIPRHKNGEADALSQRALETFP